MKIFVLIFVCVVFTISAMAADVAIVGATIYPSPTDSKISNGVVLIRAGKIVSVGAANQIRIPKGAKVIDCTGNFIMAGFQNSHVHFMESKWENAQKLPADQMNTQLQAMLTRFGFTTVVDTGSFLENTVAIRSRIESGEVNGPRILTAGGPLYPVNGIPYYLKETMPAEQVARLSTPNSPEEAANLVRERIQGGADIIKLFTGSWVARGKVLPMPVEIASAAAAEAHKTGKLVFSHASNVAGLEVALNAGVDVLAHALDDDRGFTPAHIKRIKDSNMTMIPTLKLFSGQPYTKYIVQEVGDVFRGGAKIIFGTDVGYQKDYDPSVEYQLLSQAGMSWKDILGSLTTVPAALFKESDRRGRIAPGLQGDLVVLTSDPATDPTAFTKVRYTIRLGKAIYGK